jgi:hypothetical protein
VRRSLLIAMSTALIASGVAHADDPTTTDVRCIVVAGSLSQSQDPDLQKLGNVSLLYFWGRLQGRGATTGADAKVAEAATRMTADDIKTQAQTCAAMVGAAGQALQDLGTAVQGRIGGGAPAR